MRHKLLKTHDRTTPHIARFYLAIVRLCCLLLLRGPPFVRQSTPLSDPMRKRSSRRSGGVAADEQTIGYRRNRALIARRSCRRCHNLLAFVMPRREPAASHLLPQENQCADPGGRNERNPPPRPPPQPPP